MDAFIVNPEMVVRVSPVNLKDIIEFLYSQRTEEQLEAAVSNFSYLTKKHVEFTKAKND